MRNKQFLSLINKLSHIRASMNFKIGFVNKQKKNKFYTK